MKKLIGLVAACFVCVAVVGCGGSTTAKTTTKATEAKPSETKSTEKMEEKK